MTTLWTPGSPLFDSAEHWASEDALPAPKPETDPWKEPEMSTSPTPGPCVYWRVAVPPGSNGTELTNARLAGHFAAMAHAHLTAYGDAITHGPQTKGALRAAVSDHFDPGLAAFAAAAALRGWEPSRILEAVEDGQTMHECTWEWVAEALHVPDDEVDAVMASLSTSALDARRVTA